MIRGEVLAADGAWTKVPFLLDIGADRTVLSANTLEVLRLATVDADPIAGVGGAVASVTVDAQIRLTLDDKGKALFRSQFAAVVSPESLDMSVLGRDVTNLFAVIVDWPKQVVCMIGQRHEYTIFKR